MNPESCDCCCTKETLPSKETKIKKVKGQQKQKKKKKRCQCIEQRVSRNFFLSFNKQVDKLSIKQQKQTTWKHGNSKKNHPNEKKKLSENPQTKTAAKNKEFSFKVSFGKNKQKFTLILLKKNVASRRG